jgi:hypothetical protein
LQKKQKRRIKMSEIEMKQQYYVVKEEPADFRDGMATVLYLTNAEYYDAEGCQSDWTDDFVEGYLNNLGLEASNLMEGVLEVNASVEEAERVLATLPCFEKNDGFTNLINR